MGSRPSDRGSGEHERQVAKRPILGAELQIVCEGQVLVRVIAADQPVELSPKAEPCSRSSWVKVLNLRPAPPSSARNRMSTIAIVDVAATGMTCSRDRR